MSELDFNKITDFEEKMLLWLILLVFGLPLILYLFHLRAKKAKDEKRLNEISSRLLKIQEEKIMAKREKIEEKYKNTPK